MFHRVSSELLLSEENAVERKELYTVGRRKKRKKIQNSSVRVQQATTQPNSGQGCRQSTHAAWVCLKMKNKQTNKQTNNRSARKAIFHCPFRATLSIANRK
jgi:hypothetical protein